MKTNNIIKEIWEIRGLVNKGIVEKNQELIEESLYLLESLNDEIKESPTNYTIFNQTYIISFCSTESMIEDRKNNFNHILNNMMDIYNKHVKNAHCYTKIGNTNSMLEDIWLIRAMLDDFANKANKKDTNQFENLVLIEAIENKAEELIKYAKTQNYFDCSVNELIKILNTIIATRHKYCGNQHSTSTFEELAKSY